MNVPSIAGISSSSWSKVPGKLVPLTGLTHRRNLFRSDCSVHDGHRRYRHNLWRVLLLVGEDQHTRAFTRNVEQVREIATDVGLLGIGFDDGSASASPTVSEVTHQCHQ